MSDDQFADHIRRQIQEGKPPQEGELRRGVTRAALVLALCLIAAGFALAALVQLIIH